MTASRRTIIVLALATLATGAAIPAQAQSAALVARTSDAGGVRVVVKPKSVAPGTAWEFEVTMDTHTTPLNEDLTKTTALLDDSQQRYVPTGWQGDAPGSHHRKGVLRFAAPTGQPKSFEIQMDGVGGPGRRVFQWTTK